MDILDNIIITAIETPVIVHSEKGRNFQMKDRSCYGLSLCTRGQITYTMNGKRYISNQDNAILLPQGGEYTLFGDEEGIFPVVNFKCENFNCNEIIVFPLESPQACIKNFETLKHLFLQEANNLKIYHTFYELLDNVSSADFKEQYPLHPIVKYIADNIQNPKLSNSCLARQLSISEVYFRKLFFAHYNITPKQYILDVRIRNAKQLLRDTPFTVAAIAEKCGFTSVYHFCRAFKQRTGQTPTQYAINKRVFKIYTALPIGHNVFY